MNMQWIHLIRRNPFVLFLILVLLSSFAGGGGQTSAPRSAAATNAASQLAPASLAQRQMAEKFSQGDLSFEANKGQDNPTARFIGRGTNYTAFLTDAGAVVVADSDPTLVAQGAPAATVLRFQPQGARPIQPVGVAELPGKINYMFGKDPAKWQTDVPTYGRVT